MWVAGTHSPSYLEPEVGGSLESSLGNIARPWLKKKKNNNKIKYFHVPMNHQAL
jgi:hypothetical protein